MRQSSNGRNASIGLARTLVTSLWLGCITQAFVGFSISRTRPVKLAVHRGQVLRHAASEGSSAETAETGSLVRIEFKMTRDSDGFVLDSSEGKGTLDFQIGGQLVMPALEAGVIGMGVGETKGIPLGKESFGARDEKKVVALPVDKLPPEAAPGVQLTLSGQNGQPMQAIVTKIGKKEATLDFNHPHAGIPITMTVTLVGCESASKVAEIESQLVVKTLVPGNGEMYPTRGSKLTMHYTGTLAADGTQFDSSRDRDEPFTFQIGVGQVIRGWDVGVMKMSLGERAILKIPAAMAYGEKGSGDVIPPGADLVFDVELLTIDNRFVPRPQ